MSFFSVIVRGLVRRPVRTALTLLGISIGIGAVVALVGISRGFSKSWDAGLKARGTDIVVSDMGSSLIPKPFDAALRDRIAHLSGVAVTNALLVDVTSIEDAQMIRVSAREWGGYTWQNLRLISGRMPQDPMEPAVVLGRTAADVLKKKVGDKIEVETRELSIVGIVDGNAWVENGSVILSLPLFQEVTGNQGKINIIDVRATQSGSSEDIKRLCEQINQVIPQARAVPASENIEMSEVYRIVQAMSSGTSLLAIVVGVLGVMNTMLMTVFERTEELCVLLAIGWKRLRILSLILWESALLGLAGGITGVAIGAVGVQVLAKAPAIRGLLAPDVSPRLLAISVAIAVAAGVISGLYPAWRSSRLEPSQALNR